MQSMVILILLGRADAKKKVFDFLPAGQSIKKLNLAALRLSVGQTNADAN